MSVNDDTRLPEGTMLAHYRIEHPLGAGAMGTVYLARDTALERPVAVKVLHEKISSEPDIVRRFEREARAAARVTHRNLTHVYFVGDERDRHFFVMEYVPGETLHEHVQEWGPLPFEEALDVLAEAARGLQAAHRADVVHRDVKPSNLMLLPDRTVKVTDFGLAKSTQGDADLTGGGGVMGTPRYMSPEQCRGEEIDVRTDVYALGLTAHYLLTGAHAFDGTSLGKVISDQMNSPLPRLAVAREDLPPVAQRFLDSMCEKKPSARLADMDSVLAAISDARPRTIDPAPLPTRMSAAIVDMVMVAFAIAVPGVLVEWLVGSIGSAVGRTVVQAVVYALMTAIVLFWFVFCEWKWGASPAKLAFRLQVVFEDGTRANLQRLCARFALRYPAFFTVLVPTPLGEPDTLWAELGALTELALGGLQVLFALSGIVCYLVLDRRTMSDVLTRTRVVHRAVPTVVEGRAGRGCDDRVSAAPARARHRAARKVA